MKRVLIVFVSVILAISFLGCATMAEIRTTPGEAALYINNQPRGESPTVVELSNFVGSSYHLEITKEGYEDVHVKLHKEIKVGNLILGFLIWPLWFWSWGPQDAYYFQLEQDLSSSSGQPQTNSR